MNIFEREVGGRRYRIASQSLWDSARQRPFTRQAVLGPADPPPLADLGLTRTVGTRRVGDVGALLWVAERLDLVKLIDQACGITAAPGGPTMGEMVVAVALQRACSPAAKCHLAAFLESCVPRVSCLRSSAFSGQAFHRLAAQLSDEQLQKAQVELALHPPPVVVVSGIAACRRQSVRRKRQESSSAHAPSHVFDVGVEPPVLMDHHDPGQLPRSARRTHEQGLDRAMAFRRLILNTAGLNSAVAFGNLLGPGIVRAQVREDCRGRCSPHGERRGLIEKLPAADPPVNILIKKLQDPRMKIRCFFS